MTLKTIQILTTITGLQSQLAILSAPQNRINQINATIAALQLQLTPDVEPDPDALAFAIAQAGSAVTAVQTAASATQTTLAPIALRASPSQAQAVKP